MNQTRTNTRPFTNKHRTIHKQLGTSTAVDSSTHYLPSPREKFSTNWKMTILFLWNNFLKVLADKQQYAWMKSQKWDQISAGRIINNLHISVEQANIKIRTSYTQGTSSKYKTPKNIITRKQKTINYWSLISSITTLSSYFYLSPPTSLPPRTLPREPDHRPETLRNLPLNRPTCAAQSSKRLCWLHQAWL